MKTEVAVSSIMSKNPLYVDKSTSIRDCAKLMKKHDVGGLLVKDKEELVGIIIDSDLVKRVIAENISRKDSVEKVMTTNLEIIDKDLDIHDAICLMGSKDIRHLPVKENGKVIGMVTVKDIVHAHPSMVDSLIEKLKARTGGKKQGRCESCGKFDWVYDEDMWVCDECVNLSS